MKFLNIQDLSEIKKDRIFKIARLAQARKNEGFDVYNATLGTLYNDEGQLHIHHHFYQLFNQLDDRFKASYAPGVDGGVDFEIAVKNWVFQSHDYLKVSRVVASPGGSGALSTTFSKTVHPNETIIIPDIFWGPYELMMKSKKIIAKKCALFDGGQFSLVLLKKAMLEVVQQQDNVVIVVNDPAHNPTGYSMRVEEWEELIVFCNSIATGNKTVTIINDIAYLDYAKDFEASRKYMEVFKKINDNVLVVFAFSGSKTLTAYGMRIGASIIYANQQQVMDEVHDVFENVARSTWSNANSGAIHTICRLDASQEMFKKDLKVATTFLEERRKQFLKVADAIGLKYYPTTEGFFITLVGIQDNEKLYEALKVKNIFVLPMVKGIRVAICALTLKQCETLPRLIQETIQEIEHAN